VWFEDLRADNVAIEDIDSISLNPDSLLTVRERVAKKENGRT